MNIEEAIKIYNLYVNNEKIKKFEEARSTLLAEMEERKPELEYYKSSNLYDYYIENPYKSLEFSESKIVEVQRNYSCIAKGRKDASEIHFCMSLCKIGRDEIIRMIENHIKEDNEKYLKELLGEWY